MLYFSSPYYRSKRFSGANKRFEEIIFECERLSIEYTIIVVDGNTPNGISEHRCLYIPDSVSRSRFLTWIWLNIRFLILPKGIVINDFKPIPVFSYLKHDTYLLIHDLRKILNDSGEIKGFIGRINVLMLKFFPKIITVSNHSKNLLVKNCGLLDNDIVVSYNGITSEYTSNFVDVNVDRDIDILYVAHFENRKRHIDLLEAVILYNLSLKIVFVGVDNGGYCVIKPLINKANSLGHSITILDSLSESELISLYRRTKVYAFPSSLEGFGMPIIEAKSQGCKIVCSDIDVFKEILTSSDYIFKVKDIRSLLNELEKALNNTKRYSNSAEERFLWKNIVNRLLIDIKVI
ncbi:glycosyltransferase [Psychrobacter sp. T6-1]|uniref:glycosyltransferase n=1 Tax=Psychrobacter sp. T6-1 TaxID=3457447 RepID=UPI003FD12BEC